MSTTVLPTGGRDLIERMTRKFPELFVNVDEEQRKLTTKIAQQFAFVYGTRWGNKKRAGLSDDFKSKDSLAVLESDGTISIWDMFSSGLAILVQDGQPPAFPNDSPDNTTFMPATPRDWLGGVEPQPGPGPGPSPDQPGEDLTPRVEALEAEVAGLHAELSDIEASLSALVKRVDTMEDDAGKPLKVVGRTSVAGPSVLRHWHDIDLEVHRQ